MTDALDLLQEYTHFRAEEYSRFPAAESVLQKEHSSHVAIWFSKDLQGRPTILVRPRLFIPQKKSPTLLLALNLFEQACERIYKTPGIHDLVVIIDFEGFSTKNFDLHFVRTFVSWARKYFKNLLGASFAIRSPSYALWCWQVIRIFIPAATLKKIFILKHHEWKTVLLHHFGQENLPECYGGTSATLSALRSIHV